MPLDKLKLEHFAEIANETKGCSFTISRNKKRIWVITLLNIYDREAEKQRAFNHLDINVALKEATDWIVDNRGMEDTVQLRYSI